MFKPVNRHILIQLSGESEASDEPLIVLPEDYKPEKSRYAQVQVIETAEDVRQDLKKGAKLVVDRSMIEEIVLGRTIYNVILDNYVVGIIK